MRLIVTGAAGFIGRSVAAAARAHGHTVTAVVRRAGAPIPDGCSAAVADLAIAEAITPHAAVADAVIHCAASLHGDAEAQARETIGATRQLVAAMRATGPSRIVLLSSLAVYDRAALPAGGVVDEAAPLEARPEVRGPYLAAKLAQEALVSDESAGLDWRILRPGLVFGPGRTWFYDLGLQAHPRLWVSLAGAADLPLTFVENCAQAAVAAVEQPVGRFAVPIFDDDRPTRRAYLRALATRAQPSPAIVDVPWAALAGGARLANVFGVDAGMLHPARLAARCKPLRYSNAAAKARLGWTPAVPMPDALSRSL
jgi:nucleoside-diphosphate-sugar epimerase